MKALKGESIKQRLLGVGSAYAQQFASALCRVRFCYGKYHRRMPYVIARALSGMYQVVEQGFVKNLKNDFFNMF